MVPIEASRTWLVLRCLLRVLWILFENMLGLVYYVTALIFFRPMVYFSPRLYWKIDEHFAWLGMHYVSYWMHSAVGKVLIYGDSLEDCTREPCLVVVNHQSDADPLVLMAAFRGLETLYGRLSVVLEDIFRYTHFGVMMGLRGDIFIHQGREMRHLQSRMIEDHIRRYEQDRDPRWCVLFPEGGFFEKRKAKNAAYARKNGYPLLKNVLLPRLGALQALTNVQSISSPINHAVANGDAFHRRKPQPYFRLMIDVTIAYPQKTPITLLGMLFAISPISHVDVHFRVRNIDHLAGCQEDQLRSFIFGLWGEKDSMLQRFYDIGSFPDLRIEDPLPVDYLCYLKTYVIVIAIGLPLLALYGTCVCACVRSLFAIGIWLVERVFLLS